MFLRAIHIWVFVMAKHKAESTVPESVTFKVHLIKKKKAVLITIH